MAAGTLPNASRNTIPEAMLRAAPWAMLATALVTAAQARSVPTATGAGTPKTVINSGVMIEPPPTPVSPTMAPTSRPTVASSPNAPTLTAVA